MNSPISEEMEQLSLPQMPGQGEQPKPCYLGALPPELLDLVFYETDSVRALANFITTSSFVYHRFQPRKCPILWRVLQNELGPVLTDARFLRLFPYTEPGSPGIWDVDFARIHDSATQYRDMLAEAARAVNARSPWHPVPSIVELTQLCRTLHDLNFLASTYIAVQLRSFGAEGDLAAAAPSRTERLRVLRAFYRRQIVSNAWAPTNRQLNFVDEDVAAISNTSDHQGVRLGLFAAWEPWELQQVDHVDKFIRQLCEALCLTGAEQPTTQHISRAEFGSIFSHADHLVRYMRTHQSLTRPMLCALPTLLGSNIQERLYAVAPAYDLFIRQFCLLPLLHAWQTSCSETFPDPGREQREADSSNGGGGGGASLGFTGDAVNLPPFGWVDALEGRYMNWFGGALEDHPRTPPVPENEEISHAHYRSVDLWRSAGFALWDRRRVEAVKELNIMRSLRTGWAL